MLIKLYQMVECQLPKLKVAGSSPVSRSSKIKGLQVITVSPFFLADEVWHMSSSLLCSKLLVPLPLAVGSRAGGWV